MDVGIVIVTHNSAKLLGRCLDSLAAHRGDLAVRTVVADSGSTDSVAEVCSARGISLLPGPNAGFGAAANRALALPEIAGARYALVLNPDVELCEGTLAELVALADERPGSGIIGTRQVDQHGSLICTMGVEPTPAAYRRSVVTLWSDWDWDRDRYAAERSCDWVVGSFVLLRRETLAQIGGFDERFFLFSEEVDLCTRARAAGWEVTYLPRPAVLHPVADRPLDEHRERLIVWSQLLYIRKWYGPVSRAPMRASLVALHARKVARNVRRGRPGAGDRVRLAAALRFRQRLYGPSQVEHLVAEAAHEPAAGEGEQLHPSAASGRPAGRNRE